MRCPICNVSLEDDAVFCGNCGNQIAPIHAQGATVGEATEIIGTEDSRPTEIETRYTPQRASLPAGSPLQSYRAPSARNVPGDAPGFPQIAQPQSPQALPHTPMFQSMRSNTTRTVVFVAIVLILLIVSISAGIIAITRNNTANGTQSGARGATTSTNTKPVVAVANATAFFSDSQDGRGSTARVKIVASGLNALPNGSEYNAWLVDVPTEKTLALGKLNKDGDGYSVTFTSPGFNLLAAGNKLEITQEQQAGSVPTGNVVLSATFPDQAYVHIRHLLTHFNNTPGRVGLLVGLRDQSRALNGQALLLKSNANNPQATQCIAQSIVDIIEGSKGQRYKQPGAGCNALNLVEKGDGYGLLGNGGYIANTAAHASLAATQSDSTAIIKTHAGHVKIAMDDLNKWVPTIENDALRLMNNPNDRGKVQEIVTLAEQSLNGVDLNNDESIDPVPGEAGAITAYSHGQLMTELTLKPGA